MGEHKSSHVQKVTKKLWYITVLVSNSNLEVKQFFKNNFALTTVQLMYGKRLLIATVCYDLKNSMQFFLWNVGLFSSLSFFRLADSFHFLSCMPYTFIFVYPHPSIKELTFSNATNSTKYKCRNYFFYFPEVIWKCYQTRNLTLIHHKCITIKLPETVFLKSTNDFFFFFFYVDHIKVFTWIRILPNLKIASSDGIR